MHLRSVYQLCPKRKLSAIARRTRWCARNTWWNNIRFLSRTATYVINQLWFSTVLACFVALLLQPTVLEASWYPCLCLHCTKEAGLLYTRGGSFLKSGLHHGRLDLTGFFMRCTLKSQALAESSTLIGVHGWVLTYTSVHQLTVRR